MSSPQLLGHFARSNGDNSSVSNGDKSIDHTTSFNGIKDPSHTTSSNNGGEGKVHAQSGQSAFACSSDRISRQALSSVHQAKHGAESGNVCDIKRMARMARSSSGQQPQKIEALKSLPEQSLYSLYSQWKHIYQEYLLSLPSSSKSKDLGEILNEANYRPLVDIVEPLPDPGAPQPIYPAYAGHFATAPDAKKHRRRTRSPPKSHATDIKRVERFGRQYWVRRLYEAMIDISAISDGITSVHRQRFEKAATFDAADLEATAHHIFDSAVAVHVRGWNRPSVYHKKVVRGKLTDVSEKSLETRLVRICSCLKQRKAAVDDAMRGGVTLALLCDNPEARSFTKMSNNSGNKKRGERLRRAKDTEQRRNIKEEEEEEEEEKEEEEEEEEEKSDAD